MSLQLPLDFTAALEARDIGIQRSVDHANREEPEWSGQALGLLRAYAAANGPFLIETFRAWAHTQRLPLPPDGRAFGAVVKRAAHGKHAFIARTGGTARAASSHCSDKPLWQFVAHGVKHAIP